MKFKRLFIGSIFIVLLFLACNNYATKEYSNNYNVNELFYNYPDNQIFVSGIVSEIYPDGFEVSVNKNGNIALYRVNTPYKVDLWGMTYILGTLDSSNVIKGTKIITEKQIDYDFVIIRSILGMILFLIIFAINWKFNPKKMIFTRRK